MAVEVILPKVDMDMATGQISRWFFKEGDAVRQGDVLFEIETDKASMEIDAPASGILRNITGKEGVDIPVGHAVAWIYAEGEDASAAPAAPASAPAAEVKSEKPESSSQDRSAQTAPAVQDTPVQAGAVRATPLARRLAREAGLDLSGISGSGPQGRVVKADVEAAIAGGEARAPAMAPAGEAAAPAAAAPAVKPMSDEAVLKLFEDGSYELIPHDNMRKTIARRLVEAKSTVPHFYLTVDCELDALLALRKQLNDAAPVKKTDNPASGGGEPAYKLSVNDLIIKALALALKEVPDANVSWTEGAMVKHRHADVGVAVSIPGGLITPIVRKAEEKSLSSISNEMKDLAARARTRKLKPEEYQGGTTAVSNLGMFGIRDFAAVINPPHATILAIGAGEQRAVVKGGEVKVATVMSVTLSTDHRAVDGALGAELIGAFKRLIENPMGLVV
jgi:pyruvate dehydrogenase E2 component (dihydrolipoamide acetyltransferase)